MGAVGLVYSSSSSSSCCCCCFIFPIQLITIKFDALLFGSSDDLTVLLIIIGAVVAVVVIAVIIAIVIWRITSASQSQDAVGSPRPSAPITVSTAPPAQSRFLQSQLHTQGYYNNGYQDNGYRDNEYFGHRDYPFAYHSRVNVHSDQFEPF